MRKHHSALGGVALALALTLTGCGGDDTDPEVKETPTQSPAPSTPTSTPTPKTPEEKAAAQLTAYLDVRDDAFRAATIDFKRLNKVATGAEFVRLQQNVDALRTSGVKVSGEYVHTLGDPRRRTDKLLTITDCEDRTDIVEKRAGKPVPPPKAPDGSPLANPLRIDYEVVKNRGRWLVTDQNVRWDEPC